MDKTYVRMINTYGLNVIETIFPKARAEILRLLFIDSDRSYHLRDLARMSGLAIGTIQHEVANLSASGLILEKRDGNRLYFKANTKHPIFPELQGIARKTKGLVPILMESIREVKGIELAFIYGSIAEGNAGPDSDIDLFIIGTVGLRELAPHLRRVSDTVEREINPTVMSPASFLEKKHTQDAFILNVTSGEKLWIMGSDNELAAMA